MDEAFDKDLPELDQLREFYAKIMTRKAIYDAMQTMEYQINSNRVSIGQTPFVTVGFGLGTSWFAREIQRAILLNRIRGLGKDRHTAIFPKIVFTIKHGINLEPRLDRSDAVRHRRLRPRDELVRPRDPARDPAQPHPWPRQGPPHGDFPQDRVHDQARHQRRRGRPELRLEAACARMLDEAHVPGRGVLRQHSEDHRLVQGSDGLPLVPAGLDRPEDR